MGNFDPHAWLVGFINTSTLLLDRAIIVSSPIIAQRGMQHHQVVLAYGHGSSFEEGKSDLERRLQRPEWSWIRQVLR